jgi:hypothetical protein
MTENIIIVSTGTVTSAQVSTNTSSTPPVVVVYTDPLKVTSELISKGYSETIKHLADK